MTSVELAHVEGSHDGGSDQPASVLRSPSSPTAAEASVGGASGAGGAVHDGHAQEDHVDLPQSELKPTLSKFDGVCMIVGLIIGSGIFASPGDVQKAAGAPGMGLLVWAIAGIIVCLGSLCYAELGTMIPDTGGEGAYMRAAFGDGTAFVFTWASFWVLKSGSQAIITIVFARYVGGALFFGEHPTSDLDKDIRIRIIAIVTVILFNSINSLGARSGSLVQNTLTILKLGSVVLVVFCGLYFLGDSGSHVLTTNMESAFTGSSVVGFGAALVFSLWPYDGWNNANYVVEELKDTKQLPQVITIGVSFVVIVYLIMNFMYLVVLPAGVVASSDTIGIDFVVDALGVPWVGKLMAFFVAASTAGACNASVLSGARVTYSAAREKQFPRVFGYLNRHAAPYSALICQAVWVCILHIVPLADFHNLVNYFGFGAYCFYGLSAVALILLRNRRPNLARPYKVPFYPVTPIIVILMSLAIIVSAVIEAPLASFLALAFILAGFPVYWLFFRNRGAAGGQGTRSGVPPRGFQVVRL